MGTKTNNTSSRSWKAALDMQKIDGYRPDAQFKSLIKKEIRGEISTEDIIIL